uniref:Dehydrogenase/reductase SDR family member 7B n=1 Tax=Phallusia mammillata TaxID=59560 RepID=A0A6F9DBK8_9ASCI|nr:dehydrogenase/reductase SDR family protein 7-like [Phallusia mammillata]
MGFCSFYGFVAVIICLICVLYLRNRAPRKDEKLKKLKGKVVLITGASSGLGKACCFEFRKYVCKVVLCSRNLEELKRVQKQLEDTYPLPPEEEGNASLVHKLDVADIDTVAENIRNVAALCGNRIDILVNNAGIGNKESALSSIVEVFKQVLQVNLLGSIATTKAVLPHMVSQGSGHIVGIGSIQSKVAIPFRSAYSASKHGAHGFYDSLRPEVHQYNIKVTTVNPGYINTNISKNALKADGTKYRRTENEYLTGMTPEFVAESVVNSVVKGWSENTVAPILYKYVPALGFLFPGVLLYFLQRRAAQHKQGTRKVD